MSVAPIDSSLLPADIRQGTQVRKDAYTASLGFEQLLVQQLTESLASSAREAMGGDSPYANLMPQAMSDGIMDAGGLGLARQLTDAISPAQTAAPKGTAS